ncbi:MAG: hypothetical protein JXB47_02990 [Anaerolineae bacterium]|nr:hypothetical protein [Anaerolineae bacterium]
MFDRRLRKENLDAIARALGRPWLTYQIARFGDLELDVYICQGALAMHRHPAYDELFLVYDGRVLLGSERGDLDMRAEELAVVAKGTAHQTSSAQPAIIALLRVADTVFLRRDGRWRMFASDADPPPEKVNLGALYTGLQQAYHPVQAARYEGWWLQLARCAGAGPSHTASPFGTPLLVMRGSVTVRTSDEVLPAQAGDVVIASPGVEYYLETPGAAMVTWLEPG